MPLNFVGSVTTFKIPSLRPALLGLGSLKCRLAGSVWCSYDSSTLIKAVSHPHNHLQHTAPVVA